MTDLGEALHVSNQAAGNRATLIEIGFLKRTTAMSQDLRTYLDTVKKNNPEDFLIVSREVDPAFEITAIAVTSFWDEESPSLVGAFASFMI
jgi:hypothetical protein